MEFFVCKGCWLSKAEFFKKNSYLLNVYTLDNFGVFGFNVRNGKNKKLKHSNKSSFETCVYSALRYLVTTDCYCFHVSSW